jgi:hypothetical protein
MPTNLAAKKRSYANYAGFVAAEGGAPTKPANTVAPAVTGTAAVGSTLTTTNGTWTGRPAPKLAREWLADGAAIAGATGLTYVPTDAERGKKIRSRVTGSSVGGAVAQVSNETTVVA